MYREREFMVPADTAYWNFVEEVAPALSPNVDLYYLDVVRVPYRYKLLLERTDENPSHTNHAVYQCYIVTSRLTRVRIGGDLHVHFSDTETSNRRSCLVKFDVGNNQDFGGAFYNLLVKILPGPAWLYIRFANAIAKMEYRVGGQRIVWDRGWKTREDFVEGMGYSILSAVAGLALSRLEEQLKPYLNA